MGDLDPHSQAAVESAISGLRRELSRITTELYAASSRAAEARYQWRVGQARAFLESTGTVAEREARATLVAEDQLHEKELACAVEDSLKVAAANVRSQLAGLQSLAANTRAAVLHSSGTGG